MHMHVDVDVSTAFPPMVTVGLPGTHGAVVFGMQGCGVSTPMAAAVAAATCGFDGVLHTPNGMMFTIGFLSMIVATGWFPAVITELPVGTTTSADGATPNEHVT